MKTKYVFLFVAAILFANVNNNAQAAEPSLLFKTPVTYGYNFGLATEAGQFNDEIGLFLGAKGSIVFNHQFSIGVAGYGQMSNHRLKGYSQEIYTWGYNDTTYKYEKLTKQDSSWYINGMGYGGLVLEYIFNPEDILHFTGSLFIGGGNLKYTRDLKDNSNNNMYYYEVDDYYYEYDRKESDFFVLEPAVNAELNLTSMIKIDFGVSYRSISFVNLPATTNKQLSGFQGQLSFKFGSY
ncbi:MAG: hypothetical protein A2X64_06280 [Ignavibacteria bacterium GWF2_33_9]|nr:MAG: hypothetical protein A2X64_06280 [Ignavibacteria bacterium GWF2_33_9]